VLGELDQEIVARVAVKVVAKLLVTAFAELRDGVLVADLRSPLRGVAPGQTMVLYRPDADGDEVICSATIGATTS